MKHWLTIATFKLQLGVIMLTFRQPRVFSWALGESSVAVQVLVTPTDSESMSPDDYLLIGADQ